MDLLSEVAGRSHKRKVSVDFELTNIKSSCRTHMLTVRVSPKEVFRTDVGRVKNSYFRALNNQALIINKESRGVTHVILQASILFLGSPQSPVESQDEHYRERTQLLRVLLQVIEHRPQQGLSEHHHLPRVVLAVPSVAFAGSAFCIWNTK